MSNLKGKKLLVIGGAFQHCKVVETAHELGIIVYVTEAEQETIADENMVKADSDDNAK